MDQKLLNGGSEAFTVYPGAYIKVVALGVGSIGYVSVDSAEGAAPTISGNATPGNDLSVGPMPSRCSIKVYAVGRVAVTQGDGGGSGGGGGGGGSVDPFEGLSDPRTSASNQDTYFNGYTAGTAAAARDATKDQKLTKFYGGASYRYFLWLTVDRVVIKITAWELGA